MTSGSPTKPVSWTTVTDRQHCHLLLYVSLGHLPLSSALLPSPQSPNPQLRPLLYSGALFAYNLSVSSLSDRKRDSAEMSPVVCRRL